MTLVGVDGEARGSPSVQHPSLLCTVQVTPDSKLTKDDCTLPLWGRFQDCCMDRELQLLALISPRSFSSTDCNVVQKRTLRCAAAAESLTVEYHCSSKIGQLQSSVPEFCRKPTCLVMDRTSPKWTMFHLAASEAVIGHSLRHRHPFLSAAGLLSSARIAKQALSYCLTALL
jgi:hypothetical protein